MAQSAYIPSHNDISNKFIYIRTLWELPGIIKKGSFEGIYNQGIYNGVS
jgi:hypothetical protein